MSSGPKEFIANIYKRSPFVFSFSDKNGQIQKKRVDLCTPESVGQLTPETLTEFPLMRSARENQHKGGALLRR